MEREHQRFPQGFGRGVPLKIGRHCFLAPALELLVLAVWLQALELMCVASIVLVDLTTDDDVHIFGLLFVLADYLSSPIILAQHSLHDHLQRLLVKICEERYPEL